MSFPRYPAYKDSGVEWLGEVPEHWNRTSLKFLADYQNGYPFKPDDRGEDGLPIIRISQLTGDDEPAYYCGQLDERTKVRCGDLLFSWSATIDSYIWNKGDAWLNQHIFRVSPSAEANKKYLYYVIKHVAPKLADFDAHGSTMRHIKKESLGEKVYAPSVFEQGLIATFLDHETAKIDALIAEQQRLIALLQEKRQAVISHAVTKGLNPAIPLKDSGVEWLGEVPEHWEIKQLNKLINKITNGYVGPTRDILVDDGVRYLQSLHIKNNRIVFDTPYYVSREWSLSKEKSILRVGDVLIVQTGDIGQSAVVTQEFEDCNCHALIVVSSRQDLLSGDWLSWILNSTFGRESLLSIQTGALHPHLNCGNVKYIHIPVPPKDEQAAICDHVKLKNQVFDQLISAASSSIDLMKERRSALISAAITGQIDVRGLVPEVAAA